MTPRFERSAPAERGLEEILSPACRRGPTGWFLASPARIHFVLPGRGLSGGIRVVAIYGNALVDRGHEVTVAVFRPRYPRRPDRLARRVFRELGYATGLSPDHLNRFRGKLLYTHATRLEADRHDWDAFVTAVGSVLDPGTAR